jgi:hypothetical protein
VAAELKVFFGSAPIFIPDVALAHVTGQDLDLLGGTINARFAKAHVPLYRSSPLSAGLNESRLAHTVEEIGEAIER